VLYGLYQPDEGQVLAGGEPVRFRSPRDAIARGIGMVHQHFMLVPPLTVTENIMLGQESRRGPLLDRRTAARRIAALSRQYGLDETPPPEHDLAAPAPSPASGVEPVLRVDGLRVAGAHAGAEPAVDDVSLAIAPGEIFGVAGVDGNGQTELAEALTGLRPAAA